MRACSATALSQQRVLSFSNSYRKNRPLPPVSDYQGLTGVILSMLCAYLGFVCCASSINVTQEELSIVSFRQTRRSSLFPNAAKDGWVGQGSCKIQRNMKHGSARKVDGIKITREAENQNMGKTGQIIL